MVLLNAIAIDGPVASGKTVAGRLVAQRLRFRFMDTGVVYRAVTWEALSSGTALEDESALVRLARELTMQLVHEEGDERLLVDGQDITDHLRDPEVERGVSLVAKVPGVRRGLVRQQRAIAEESPIVMAGRDIGTVVLPDAQLKVYLTASVDVRARRRYLELQRQGNSVEYAQVESELKRRDKIDSERVDSPLRPANDAKLIDTNGVEVEALVDLILDYVGRN